MYFTDKFSFQFSPFFVFHVEHETQAWVCSLLEIHSTDSLNDLGFFVES